MGKVCGNCKMYHRMPFEEHICIKTGRVVPFLAHKDCYVADDDNLLTQDTNNMAENVKTKVCKVCGRELPLDQFRPNHKSPDGHLNTCRDCMKEKMNQSAKERKQEHLDKNFGKQEEVSPSVEKAFSRAKTNISSALDIDLVMELRSRGWDVKCTRIIEL